MKKEKTDRRVQYTVMVLKDALVQSMQKEHISNISVKSICALADVNRSTFYAHFSDQYDLLNHIENEVMDNIKEYLAKQDFHDRRPVSVQVLARILEYVSENADLFKALLGDNCDPGFQREVMNIPQWFPFEFYGKAGNRTKDYLAVFGIMGCVSILQKWLNDGMPETPMEMAEFLLQVLYNGPGSFE